MTSLRNILVMLFLIGTICAFHVDAYLYPTENQSDVSFSEFTYNSMPYKLVKIKDEPTFMLKNEEIVNDSTEIQNAFLYLAKTSYVPSDKELSDLKSSLAKFNNSRNDGLEIPGDEEYACRDIYLFNGGTIVIDGKVIRCTDYDSCVPVARGLFAIYQKILQVRQPSEIIPPLLEFTNASYQTDSLMVKMFSDLENAKTVEAAYESITDFKDSIPKVKALVPKITKNKFRSPLDAKENANECTDYRCLGICGTFVFDTASLDTLATKSNDLYLKVSKLKSPASIGSKILNNTLSRIAYVSNENSATLSTGRFDSLKSNGDTLINYTKLLLTKLDNQTIAQDLFDFSQLHEQIPAAIASRNLTGIDAKLARYSELMESLNKSATEASNRYDKVIDEKNKVQSLLFTIETGSLSSTSQDSLKSLQSRSSNLELKLTTAVSEADLQTINSEYLNLESESQNLLKSESELPASRGVLFFRAFAKRVNIELSKETINDKSISGDFLLFSFIVFISFTAILILIALTILFKSRKTIPKFQNSLLIMSVCAVVVILGFSAFLYLLLSKTATEATLSEFKSDFDSRPNAAVVIDLRNATEQDAQTMKACAQKLMDSFDNKKSELYLLDYTSCNKIENGVPSYSTYCDSPNKKTTTFYLRYATTTFAPKFSTIYDAHAEIRANTAYYSSCPLPSLIG